MTIVALHHTTYDIFAIADGLISRNPGRVIEEDQKIVLFEPRYQIPQVQLGHFNGFSKNSGAEFGLAYAGNYSLISTIIKSFTDIVSRSLVLDRDSKNGGEPKIFIMSDADKQNRFRSTRFYDSYNFDRDELVPITVDLLMDVLEVVCAEKCKDFHVNAMTRPNAHFLIFGTEKLGRTTVNRGQIIKCMDFVNGEMECERFSTLPSRLNCIGDSSVIPDLIKKIESSDGYATVPTNHDRAGRGLRFVSAMASAESDRVKNGKSFKEPWPKVRETIIETEVMRVIAKDIGTIGGSCTIAKSGRFSRMNIRTIGKIDVRNRFNTDVD